MAIKDRGYDSPQLYREDLTERIRALGVEIRECTRQAAALEAKIHLREAAMALIEKRSKDLAKKCAAAFRSSRKLKR